MILHRRSLTACLFPAILLLPVACSDREAAQRKAFIEFLQARVLARPGVRVPQLTAEESASFGPYAEHYAVIRDFHDAMNRSISGPMASLMGQGSIRSLQELMAKREALGTVRTGAAGLRAAIEQELAKANNARAALKQPDDLKKVYDAAFDKIVTAPAQLFVEIFPALDRTLAAGQEMVVFLDRNRAQVKINGNSIEIGDPALKGELDALLGRLAAEAQTIQEAQRRLQAMLRG